MMNNSRQNLKVSSSSGSLKVSARHSSSDVIASKSKRQAIFNSSCEGMSSSEAAMKASLFGEINPSEFRILRMVG